MRQPQSAARQEPLTIEVRGRRLALTSTTTVGLGAVLLVLVTVNTTLNALDHQLTISHIGAGVAAVLSYAGVGIVVVRHQPRNLLEVGLIALPIGMGVGILKYRLYEIDRIISRTLAYAIVTGLLIGLYAGLVLVATQVFGFRSPVAVAAATLAAAALFNPLRRRVQRAVDRRFKRARYDAEQTVAAFATRLKEALDLDSVRDDLAGVVQQTLEPAHVAVVTIPQKLNSLGSERGLATPSPDGKGRETSRPPH